MPRSRVRRYALRTLAVLGVLVLLAVGGVVAWSQIGVMPAEPEPLASVTNDPRITVTDAGLALVLTPTDPTTSDAPLTSTGLVMIPGAKVEAAAYVATFADVVTTTGVTVVITKPWLNLAFFDVRPLSTFTDLAPTVDTWMVAGHSLGGVRACQLASDTSGVILLASYCATDISTSTLPVLSISGSEDRLSTPEKIADARPLLPETATMREIEGANHAGFGAYGEQSGDGVATLDPATTRALISEDIITFLMR